MKPVTMFVLQNCPYCKQALSWMEELKNENSSYGNINVKIIDEGVHPEIADTYDYYFVPTYYVNEEKVHEGAATKDKIRGVFDKALS